MTDNEKEQLKQYMLEHKEETQELFETIQALSKNQNAQELVMKIINKLKERGGMADLFGAEILEGFIEAAKNFDKITDSNRADGEDKTEAKPVKKARSIHADYYISPIDKLSKAVLGCNPNFSLEEFFDPDGVPISTGKKISALAFLRYENMPEDLQDKIPNRRTRAVHDAFTSLIDIGNKAIRLRDLAFAMNGYRTDREPTEAFLKEIEPEAEWLIHTWCRIDASNEAKARGYNFKEVIFNKPLIQGSNIEVINRRGQRVKAYEILAEPVLYSYAKQKKQVISVPIDILALPEKLNLTFDNIILRNYLIEQIEGMSQGILGCVILYETLYEVLDAQETSRQNKSKIRENAKILLDDWIEKGYIHSYFEEPKQAGVAKRAIVITPYMRKKFKALKRK